MTMDQEEEISDGASLWLSLELNATKLEVSPGLIDDMVTCSAIAGDFI